MNNRHKHSTLNHPTNRFQVETMEPLIVLSASSLCGGAIVEYFQAPEPTWQPDASYAPAPCDGGTGDHREYVHDEGCGEVAERQNGKQCDKSGGDGASDNGNRGVVDRPTDESKDFVKDLIGEASQLIGDIESLIGQINTESVDKGADSDDGFVFAPTININGDNNDLTFNLTVDIGDGRIENASFIIDSNVEGSTITTINDSHGITTDVKVVGAGNDADDSTDGNGGGDDSIVHEFRTIDGTGNNLADPSLGATGSELIRLAPANYADDLSTPAEGPNARLISNIVNDQDASILNEYGISDYLWVWGQFIDHDMDLSLDNSGEFFNIKIPAGDHLFDPDASGDAIIPLQRSGFVIDEYGVRQQVDNITAFIDASQVYGSDAETQAQLRSFEGGQLTMPDGLLQTRTDERGNEQFFSGDIRAGENIALTSMHTLFSREHNRIAAELAETEYHYADLSNPDVDEEIYQRARAIVGAQMQHITYNEFLPTLLGDSAISTYDGYDSYVDPRIATEFSTAAFRVGHTMLSPELLRLDAYGNEIDQGNVALRDAFFRGDVLVESGIAPILQGAAAQTSQAIDPFLIDDVRNFLFGEPGQGGFDLASLNIQRAYDHGLASYNDTREAIGLDRVESFHDISSDHEIVHRLKSAFSSVDEIGLWVGGLAEDHVGGGTIGETFQTIIVDQFERLRDGDRFWYESSLSESHLAMVKDTRLSDIIRRNTTAVTVQDNVFLVPDGGSHYA